MNSYLLGLLLQTPVTLHMLRFTGAIKKSDKCQDMRSGSANRRMDGGYQGADSPPLRLLFS